MAIDEPTFDVKINARTTVQIPVDARLMTNFFNQFKTNTKDQQNRKKTLYSIAKAAYLKGLADGKAANP